jgi:DNA invertase Pin-like site-specific DNA recombinase
MVKLKKFVTYFRVSTDKQGKSGLGLEAQQESARLFIRDGEVLASFTEVESGKRSDRPELARALAICRRTGATLVVAKLDRLARNVAFISSLMETKVEFVACDNPTANRLTLHLLAAFAEHEAEQISERTKAGLAAAKRRGVKLGSARKGHWAGREDARRRGGAIGRQRQATAAKRASLDAYGELLPVIQRLRDDGETLRAIAAAMNERGEMTLRGREWRAQTVKNALTLAMD